MPSLEYNIGTGGAPQPNPVLGEILNEKFYEIREI
jgi:hypothetical protein